MHNHLITLSFTDGHRIASDFTLLEIMLQYISFYPSANISFLANISVQVTCISDMHVLEFDKY